jgi:hypothetical protein
VLTASREEYWMMCVRLEPIAAFLKSAPPETLRLRFCDVAFKSYVRHCGGKEGQTGYLTPTDS